MTYICWKFGVGCILRSKRLAVFGFGSGLGSSEMSGADHGVARALGYGESLR